MPIVVGKEPNYGDCTDSVMGHSHLCLNFETDTSHTRKRGEEMSMSRKDFSILAKVLSRANAHNHNASQIIHAITEELTNEYPNFSPSRFLDACGVENILGSKEHYPIQVPRNQVLMVDDSPQEDRPREMREACAVVLEADALLDMSKYPEEIDLFEVKELLHKCLRILGQLSASE